MNPRRILTLAPAALGLLLGTMAPAKEPEPAQAEFFEKAIRPILVERCQKCHGEAAPKGGLSLLSRAGLMQGGDSGPAAVEGKPEESPLIHAVRYVDEPRMPPKKRLAEPEIDAITKWVEMGLPWPESAADPAAPSAEAAPSAAPTFAITDEQRAFWSFRPVIDPPLPAAIASTPVDRFLLAKLAEKGFRPAPPADKRTLLRRATFDLIGLPPAPEEVDAFLADESPEAFAKVVDRLLASPRYGERWGRHWLDLVRYADTAGETADFPIPQAHRYRDYVIDAYNRDLPYDQFVREQIAGDLLAADGPRERYEAKLVATGYLAIARRFGFDPQNYHNLTIDDTIDALGKSVLGLSIACARCHDHKFDPIAQADYYAIYGILDSTKYPFPGSEEMRVPRDFSTLLPAPEVEAMVAPHRAKMAPATAEVAAIDAQNAAIDKAIAEATPQAPPMADRGVLDALRKRKAEVVAARAEAGKRLDALAAQAPGVELAYAVAEGTPHDAKIHRRGDPRTPGALVPRHFPLILGGQTLPPGDPGSGRRQLAGWLTDPRNPLTARVMVNRLWHHHFGRGIVATPSDFGKRGRAPSHPELLDYLAARFVESGWSIKTMHRTMMLTDAYRMSGDGDPRLAEADPENEWLARFPRRRLEAEAIRDAMLTASGDLDLSPAGPHPFPPPSQWGFSQHQPFQAVYESRHRSVFLMSQRLRRHPFLALFDGADTNVSTDHRSTTTVPTQALFFLNNPLVHDQSAKFAARLLRDEPADDARRVDRAHRLAFGRPATPGELLAAADYLRDAAADLQSAGVPAAALPAASWASYGRVLFGSNEFLYVD